MAKIREYRDIPLDDLRIGTSQIRTASPGAELSELAESIRVQGQLQPIVVCDGEQDGRWEILAGQRRFLAIKLLQRRGAWEHSTIAAAVLDERVSEEEAKAISITENLVRRKLSGRELIDGVTFLYNRYGSIQDVVDATGLAREHVSNYVKFPRLKPELQGMVEDGLDVNVALKAQDAATNDTSGKVDIAVAKTLAEEMKGMSGVQRKRVVDELKSDPDRPIENAIEAARSASKVTQITVTLTKSTHSALQRFASQQQSKQDDAAATLIEEALAERDLLSDS